MQQISKALKLVHDDQVRLQRFDARVRELAPQLADQIISALAQLIGVDLPTAWEEVADSFEFFKQRRIGFDVTTKAVDDPVIDALKR